MRKFFTLFVAALCCASMFATEGALPGRFTINAQGDQIVFSQGNLQATYDGSSWSWAFAANQYDYIGNAEANTAVSGNAIDSNSGTVDLFGWSTKATRFGIHNSTDYSIYSDDFNDWGNNPIINGGNKEKLWRTLTRDEWKYIFVTRPNAASLFALGNVNGVNGAILLPDNWNTPVGVTFTASTTQGLAAQYGGYYYDNSKSHFADNTYNAEQWKVMESAGAVFLPCAGMRYGKQVTRVDANGYYWSATTSGVYYAFNTSFDANSLDPLNAYNQDGERYFGLSVRLVKDVQAGEGIENIATPTDKARKVMMDGTLYIATPDGKIYNATGVQVK